MVALQMELMVYVSDNISHVGNSAIEQTTVYFLKDKVAEANKTINNQFTFNYKLDLIV